MDFYFKKLDGIVNQFPENISGECGYVAASILLSYYACFVDSNIISSQYISPVNNDSFDINNWDYVPCANSAFMHLLETDIYPDASISFTIESSIDWYLTFYTNVRNYHYVYDVSDVLPLYSTIRNNIDNGVPIILFGNYQYNDLGTGDTTTVKNHSIIAYGYDSSVDDMLLTHFGWDGYNQVWINYNYWSNGPFYYLYIGDHVHSNLFTVNGHNYCVNDNLHISEYNYCYEYESRSSHKICCDCGYTITYEEHEFIPYLNGNINLKYLPINHYICSKCGYIQSIYN